MTDTTTFDPEAAAELAAYRDGGMQLAYDPHTATSPHSTSFGYLDGEPTTHVQHTYDGQPAWLCQLCLKVTLAAEVADDQECRGCGSVDTLGALLHSDPCTDEAHEEGEVQR